MRGREILAKILGANRFSGHTLGYTGNARSLEDSSRLLVMEGARKIGRKESAAWKGHPNWRPARTSAVYLLAERRRAGVMMIRSGISKSAILVATKQQVSCELGDEAAILNMKNSVYYGLNPVGARIWQLLQQPRRFDDLRESILREYDVTPERAEADLVELLEKLLSEGLVEIRTAPW